MRDECEHGSLRRKCNICGLQEDVDALEQEIESLRQALGLFMTEAERKNTMQGSMGHLRNAYVAGKRAMEGETG